MRTVGNFFQLLALFILPLSLVLEASGSLNRDTGVSDMVVMMLFGAALFGLGRFIAGYAR